jgi:hypothetical protein
MGLYLCVGLVAWRVHNGKRWGIWLWGDGWRVALYVSVLRDTGFHACANDRLLTAMTRAPSGLSRMRCSKTSPAQHPLSSPTCRTRSIPSSYQCCQDNPSSELTTPLPSNRHIGNYTANLHPQPNHRMYTSRRRPPRPSKHQRLRRTQDRYPRGGA